MQCEFNVAPFLMDATQLLALLFICSYWPREVRDRVRSTYTYFASGIGVTAVTAYMAARTQVVTRLMVTRPILVCMSVPTSLECFALTLPRLLNLVVICDILGWNHWLSYDVLCHPLHPGNPANQDGCLWRVHVHNGGNTCSSGAHGR